MADIKIGDITVYEDDDGKAVWEFEGKVQSDIPLDTKAQDFAGAINELKKLSEGEGGEWQPPDDWLEVPEPGAWEANFLIEIRNKMTFGMSFYDPTNGYQGRGNVIIDWGDGTVETYVGYTVDEQGFQWGNPRARFHSHTYAEQGQYVVKATVDELSCFLYNVRDAEYGSQSVNILIAKTGKKICLDKYEGHEGSGTFGFNYRLHWAKINGSSKMQGNGGFQDCVSLKRLDLAVPMTEIPPHCFSYANIPKNFDFSKITKIDTYGFYNANLPEKIFLPECMEIGANAFYVSGILEISAPKCTAVSASALSYNYFLSSFYAPACTSVGSGAFNGCYALETAEFAEDCTFGTNCFQNCYSLYTRPDGSTN